MSIFVRVCSSDVGAGYSENEDGKTNALSRIPLNWMYNEAKKSGVKMKPLDKVDQQLPNTNGTSENELKQKYIHDSRFFYEKLFGDDQRTIYYDEQGKDNATKITVEK